ncbi:MAG TPA: phosphatase PAP2 family protein [Acidimicrobiales bacterium]|nr:phosphatase PAP2 family protein [Acidimicrobiales bacterium]
MKGAEPDQHRAVIARHPADVVRAAAGTAVLGVCTWLAWDHSLSDLERGLFHAINDLPSWLYRPLWLVMQCGALGAAFVVAAVALCFRRLRLGAELFAAGVGAYYAAVVLKNVVDRGRPGDLLNNVVFHGPAAHGLGFPSGHAAVSCALAATAFPFLAGRWRWALWLIPLTVGFARVFVGAHFPLDVLGGFALGYTVAALTHLVGGSPDRRGFTPARPDTGRA